MHALYLYHFIKVRLWAVCGILSLTVFYSELKEIHGLTALYR